MEAEAVTPLIAVGNEGKSCGPQWNAWIANPKKVLGLAMGADLFGRR
jgi:hypothetical protein